jgi:hypothetical protein
MKSIIAAMRRLEDEYRNLPPQLRKAAAVLLEGRMGMFIDELAMIGAKDAF